MRRSFIPLIILALISWSVFAYIVIFFTPESNQIITVFLLILFLALSSSSTIIINTVSSFLAGHFANKQIIFYESLRRGIILSVAVIGLGVLKLTWALNIFNFLILILILGLTEIYFTKYS